MQNAAGNWVEPSAETFAAAAASADWASAKDFNLVITNAPGEQAWPITATNFMLMQKQPKDAAQPGHPGLLQVGLRERPGAGHRLDYVPLPAELVNQIEAYWATDLK
jgi:phosphate transport system substrate-binding protein